MPSAELRIVVIKEVCDSCSGKRGRMEPLYVEGPGTCWVPCEVCNGTGKAVNPDLSAKAQKVLEFVDKEDEMWIYGEVDTYCRYCESLRNTPHADDCPHVLAKEVLGT